MRITRGICVVLTCAAFCVVPASGQERDSGNSPNDPPPLKVVSREERAQLSAARDPKMRIHLSLELTEARLRRVEELTAGREYAGATGELWSYQALVEDTLRFLDELKNTGKTRDLYRRVEITLRGHAPRLEAVRRVTPYEHAVQIKTVAAYVRDARADALNAFYGDTVVRGSAFREPERSAEDQHSKDKSASELSKRP